MYVRILQQFCAFVYQDIAFKKSIYIFMNSRNTHLSEYTIKGLICDQYPDWKSLTPNQITLSRLAGLTNITYKAEAILDTTPK
jgi:hypothetical protein